VNETIQVVVPPALRGPLEQWLRRRNLVLLQIPPEALGDGADDDLPTYVVQPA
jgi:hypothetical protein